MIEQVSKSRPEWMLHAAGVSAALICIATAIAVQSYLANKTLRLSEDIQSIESLLSRSDVITQSLEQSRNELSQVREAYDAQISRIPAKLVDSDVLTGLHRISDDCHCNLLDISPGTARDFEIDQARYRSKQYQLQLEGNFGELYQFLASLPSLGSRYEIHRCRIGEPSAVGGACKMELELRLLYDLRWKTNDAIGERI